MIVSKCPKHGATINALAKEGKMGPTVRIIFEDGKELEANSTLAALGYLAENNISRNAVDIR